MKIIAVKKCENCYKFNDSIYDSEDIPTKIMNSLTIKEYTIFLMRYFEDKKLEDIAKYFNVTRERIRQIELKMYSKLGRKIPNLSLEEIKHAVEINADKFIGIKQKTIWVLSDEPQWRESFIINKMHESSANYYERLAQAKTAIDNGDDVLEACEDNRPLEILELSIRTENCLKSAGYKTIADVVNNYPDNIRQIRNLGLKSFADIREELKNIGYLKDSK